MEIQSCLQSYKVMYSASCPGARPASLPQRSGNLHGICAAAHLRVEAGGEADGSCSRIFPCLAVVPRPATAETLCYGVKTSLARQALV